MSTTNLVIPSAVVDVREGKGKATIETSQEFLRSLWNPEIRKFVTDFERWNNIAGPFMNRVSYPYRSLQRDLVSLLEGKVGPVLLDYGCGAGYIAAALVKCGDKFRPSRIVAVDPDLGTLSEVQDTLAAAGYRGKLSLLQSSSMVPLSTLQDGEVDTIASGLGAITYSGFHLNSHGVLAGRKALLECLKECHRVLKPQGLLGFSSLIPEPNFKRIKWETICSLFRKGEWWLLATSLPSAKTIERLSAFMADCALAGKAHYLTEEEWTSTLSDAGFVVTDVKRGGYAGQGIAFVAKKA